MHQQETPQAASGLDQSHVCTCATDEGNPHQNNFAAFFAKRDFKHLFRFNTDKNERHARQAEMMALNLHKGFGAIGKATDPTQLH